MAFKQRKFRNKVSADDEDGEDGPPQIRPPQHQLKKDQAAVATKQGPSGSSLVASKGDVKKDSKGSKLNLLSFEDDGDDPGFVPKKDSKKEKQRQSKLARAPALQELPTDTAPQTLRSTAGEYTAERLKDLQRNAISFSAARLAAGNGSGSGSGGGAAAEGAAGPAEPVIKLSGSFKRTGAAKDDRFSLPGSSIALVLSEEGPADAMPLPPPPRPGGPSGAPGGLPSRAAKGSAVLGAVEEGDEDGDDGDIPDQQTIMAAKAKRERLRQAHLAPDYIPTSGLGLAMGRLRGTAGPGGAGAGRGASVGPGGSGGTEGGEGGEGSDSDAEAEETMRIRFSGKEGGRPPKDMAQYTQAMGGDDDEEAFAEEQLRKALRLQQIGGTGVPAAATAAAGAVAAAAGAAAAGMAAASAAAAAAAAAGGAGGAVYAFGVAAAVAPSAFTVGSGGSRLAAITAAGDSAVASLADGLRRLQTAHKQVRQTARRTADNLTASLAKVEQLESELKAAGDKYLYMQKLRAYVADLCDCLQVKSAIVEELEDSRLELMEDRAQAARTGVRQAEKDLLAPAEAAVTAAMAALGRGAGTAAAAAAAESAARDARGRAAGRRGSRGGKKAVVSSGSRYREIVEAANTVFADADEEFASIGAVKRRLEEWKARYPKDYTNAYMHLSNPALFAPYVRLELLRWDPLYGKAEGAPYQGFDTQEWYGELFEYGMNAADGAAMSDDDPDSELVPQLVRKLVLPLALHWIERCWDVVNGAHTRAVAALASELLVYVPAEEERMVELLSVIRGALEAAVEACTLPPWPPAVLACCPLASRVLFRRFRGALRLLHSISSFEGLLARSLLTRLALGRLVSGQLMPYLRAAAAAGGGEVSGLGFAVAAVEAVVAGLHSDWFSTGPLPEGTVLLEHVVWLGRAVEQQRGSGGDAGLAARLARVMARLGDLERSNRLAAAFGIRTS
ncbi:hypothetical protein VOLCADRAFT_86421 [Volvox carteri f. nagariensis]|uniref:GCF C-terminal domain-containing protein n=1 Tax=Volvox carteri f. nagariensis TaxID=3068 RepID=D8TIQ8_VOLCA|nr:uncharacterized protein VOLCADRAFT_86421 [Volvox carteri f. nagariensis]EFJ52932.1 hypothetical protein VOLCADRAFT_86421 [Volvox carteri f. nagariensis]|eukprot:XP_002945937.1 hypothetical protein VOLCADRAFT_86421 [Volvox carteri f. nagariensis]